MFHKYSTAASDRESLSKPWPRPIVQDWLFFVLGSQREQRREIERKRRERISNLEHVLDIRGKRAGQLLCAPYMAAAYCSVYITRPSTDSPVSFLLPESEKKTVFATENDMAGFYIVLRLH